MGLIPRMKRVNDGVRRHGISGLCRLAAASSSLYKHACPPCMSSMQAQRTVKWVGRLDGHHVSTTPLDFCAWWVKKGQVRGGEDRGYYLGWSSFSAFGFCRWLAWAFRPEWHSWLGHWTSIAG